MSEEVVIHISSHLASHRACVFVVDAAAPRRCCYGEPFFITSRLFLGAEVFVLSYLSSLMISTSCRWPSLTPTCPPLDSVFCLSSHPPPSSGNSYS